MALRVAKEVDIAGYTGLGIHEETLSDLVLNRIRYEYADNFLTRKFTRKEEGSVTGADWLWCIGEPGSWITFAVQAKIVNVDTGRVNYLHYRKGEQHDILINFCRQFRFIPKYSIYGKINDEIKVFYVDKYWHGREKANCYLVSLKEYDTSGMLAYFNINLDERWIGSPVGTSKKHYDFIGGHLFQSETGGYFTPFQNEIKGFNFDPQLSFTETQIKFKVPPKTLKFDSVRIELK
jgi:hypothetical protein